jgi:hypothetical protein
MLAMLLFCLAQKANVSCNGKKWRMDEMNFLREEYCMTLEIFEILCLCLVNAACLTHVER